MENKEIILLRVSVSLNTKGFREITNVWEGLEKTKVFDVVFKSTSNGEMGVEELIGNKRRVINKDRLMQLESKIDSPTFHAYSVWCLPEQEEEAKELCRERINVVITKLHEEVSLCYSHVHKFKSI